MENFDLKFFGPGSADQQITEPDIISRTLRVLFAKRTDSQFVFAGAQAAGSDAGAHLRRTAVSIDDSTIGACAVRDTYDRAVEIVFDLRSSLVTHQQFGRQCAVVAGFGPPCRHAL